MNAVRASALLLLLLSAVVGGQEIIRARVILDGTGVLDLSTVDGAVKIVGHLHGLKPAGRHGFHVHQFGDIFTNGCLSTGGHFNPNKVNHGAPTDAIRHVGDLGNIFVDSAGNSTFEMFDPVIALDGPNSILGRAFVLHSGEDDLGKVGNEGSRKTGNAGSRIACGIVFLVQ